MQGFHDGSLVKNPPAKAGDTGSIPDPGRFPHAEQQLSRHVTTIEPVPHDSRGHCHEKLTHLNKRVAPIHRQLEKACTAVNNQHSQK